MMTERQIQVAVARADLILCEVLRRLPVVLLLTALLLAAVILVRARWPDRHRIDYDAPGVDITSEGPEGDYTAEWYRWTDESSSPPAATNKRRNTQ